MDMNTWNRELYNKAWYFAAKKHKEAEIIYKEIKAAKINSVYVSVNNLSDIDN